MDELFSAIREAASKAIWSQGVTLARKDHVTGDFADNDEIILRVQDDQRAVAAEVHLYPDDEDWQCDCQSDDDPCKHVAAAAIAVRAARKEGKALPKAKAAAGKVVYELRRSGDAVALDRWIEDGGTRTPLTQSLTSGRVPVAATKFDMSIDVAMGALSTPLKASHWRALFPYLAEVDLTLDGKPITCNAQTLGILVTLQDEGPGIQLTAKRDPLIDEYFANGLVRVGNQLHLIHVPKVGDREHTMLKDGRFFAASEFDFLAGEVIPRIRDQVRLDIQTDKLPGQTFAKPRLTIDVSQDDHRMALRAQIVYGDPPVARIVNGRLVSLGEKVPARDLDRERTLRDDLWRTLELPLEDTVVVEGAKCLVMADKLRRWQGDVRGAIDAFRMESPLTPTWDIQGDNISFQFTGSHGGKTVSIDPQSVLQAWKKGDTMFAIPGGGFAPLPQDWLKRFGARIIDLLDQKKESQEIPRASAPFIAELLEEDGIAPPPSLKSLADVLLDSHSDQLPLPDLSRLHATLRPYQEQGVRWLNTLKQASFGAMLADDMGLGKTLQAITVMEKGTLVLAPTSLLSNWQREISKFRPDLKVLVYHGINRQLDPEADVTLTTYGTMRRDIDALSSPLWNMIVLDEAQAIKNPDSQVARATHKLQAKFRLCLSGTPLENHLDDVWSQFHFLNPGLLGTRQGFSDNYTKLIKQNPEHIAILRGKLAPFILRRLKKDVAKDLPERIDQTLYVDLNDEERNQYEAILAATREDVQKQLGEQASVFEILEALLRLRQACCHRGLLPGQEIEHSSKVDLLVDRLLEAKDNGSRALVFSQWTSLLDLVTKRLEEHGITYQTLTGETKNRGEVVASFQAGEGDVLLMTLKAGGVGLNLTAADQVYILDPWWNPAAEDQAADRAHRIGQTQTVMVYKLVATDTIEENILALQDKKRELAQGLLDAETLAGKVTRQDLLDLIQ